MNCCIIGNWHSLEWKITAHWLADSVHSTASPNSWRQTLSTVLLILCCCCYFGYLLIYFFVPQLIYFYFYFLSHTLRYSGFILVSVSRNHSWRCFGNQLGCWCVNWGWPGYKQGKCPTHCIINLAPHFSLKLCFPIKGDVILFTSWYWMGGAFLMVTEKPCDAGSKLEAPEGKATALWVFSPAKNEFFKKLS